MIGTITVVTAGVLYFGMTRAPIFQGSFQLRIQSESPEGRAIAAKGAADTASDEAVARPNAEIDYATQISILLSPRLLDPVAKSLKSQYPDLTGTALANSITIGRVKNPDSSESSLLQITYEGTNREQVDAVVDALSKSYLNYSRDERVNNLNRASRFVDEQLPSVQQEVDKLEKALQTFRQQNNLIDPSTQASQLTNQISSINQQQLDAQVQLTQTKALYRSLQQQLRLNPDGAVAASVLSESPEYQRAVTQLQEIETQIAQQSAQLTDNNPTLKVLQSRRRQLLPLVERRAQRAIGNSTSYKTRALPFQNSVRLNLTRQFVEAASQVRTLEARVLDLSQIKQNLETRFNQLPALSRQYESLQRKLQVNTTSLGNLLARREELRINAARQEKTWELFVPPSTPSAVTSMGLPRSLAIGIILGSLLGAGLALAIDNLKRAIHTPKELRAITKLRLLGVIPTEKNLEKILDYYTPSRSGRLPLPGQSSRGQNQRMPYRFSPFIEALRKLYANIYLLKQTTTAVRSLVISSALPGEGKSTISAHLARTAAAMGQRVLVVDADLRNPQVHHLLGLTKSPGLGEVLSSELPLEDAIQSVPHEDNLFALTAGLTSIESASLLSSRQMLNLIEQLNIRFDLVIYDTTPLGFADAALLSAHTDGLVLVSKLGTIDHTSLNHVLELLEVSGLPVLGVVANCAADKMVDVGNYMSRYYARPPQEPSNSALPV
jgi:capsular exopolysaccharide synthesis family protein